MANVGVPGVGTVRPTPVRSEVTEPVRWGCLVFGRHPSDHKSKQKGGDLLWCDGGRW